MEVKLKAMNERLEREYFKNIFKTKSEDVEALIILESMQESKKNNHIYYSAVGKNKRNINLNKAPGFDLISGQILKEMSKKDIPSKIN